MSIFWYEFLFFIVAIFGVALGFSSAVFFAIAYRNEKQSNSSWRSLSFLALGIAFFIFILERRFSFLEPYAVSVYAISMIAMYFAAYARASVIHLIYAIDGKSVIRKKEKDSVKKTLDKVLFWTSTILIILVATALVIHGRYYQGVDVLTVIQLVTVFTAIGIVVMKILNVVRNRSERKNIKPNMLSAVAYFCLGIGAFFFIFYRFPETDIVFLRLLTLEYSIAWKLGLLFTGLGILSLIIESWDFIKYRVYFRIYVVFLLVAMVVSALGSFIFTALVFDVVEQDNLDLVTRAAETQELILEDHSKTALFVAQLIADEDQLLADFEATEYQRVYDRMESYVKNADLDILRVYNKFGEVYVSPTDVRDQGRMFNEDDLVSYTITEKTQVRSYDTEEGVLSPIIVVRAFHPLVKDGVLLGAVEVGYKFDNAFVDYSKMMTGLDVTIYTNNRRSATTIKTLDGVSRWVGSEETDKEIVEMVLTGGKSFSKMTERLGHYYYSAFKPLRDVNGNFIGMISVGKIANELFESTRQRLIMTFLINFFICFLATGIGYGVLYTVSKKERNGKINGVWEKVKQMVTDKSSKIKKSVRK